MPPTRSIPLWRFLRPLAAPLLVLALALTLWEPIAWWLHGEERYDRHALKEWIQESKISYRLPELVGKLLTLNETWKKSEGSAKQEAEQQMVEQREQIRVFLRALGEPVTKMYSGQLPLFPIIYRLEVYFDAGLGLDPIFWDSELPRQTKQYRQLPKDLRIDDRGAYVAVQYQLRVYAWQQALERQETYRRLRVGGLVLMAAVVVLVWIYLAQRRERDRQRQRLLAERQLGEAERRRLEEELGRQEAERRREEAERVSLELKSQLFANISVMAGSYAHNIKNLLVRPNDLLNRCLENDGLPADQDHMLREVRHTLGTVTERLQQILHTVRRDPTRAEMVRIDLNDLAREAINTWEELAREKWKLSLTLDLAREPLAIQGDRSHLQQALENLLFNARDATFEMRAYLRGQARQKTVGSGQRAMASGPWAAGSEDRAVQSSNPGRPENSPESDRRQALIAAAAWKGAVVLRTRLQADHAILEVQDNGIGMSREVKERCLQAHYSTKRDNALFAGQGAGMGLGLTFVAVILDHHRATLSVESEPLRGTTFRAGFPLCTGH
jgi:signal transduction histidine kinase